VFQRCMKNRDETFAMYSNQPKSLLVYYLESRFCSDFLSTIDLVVYDRIKQDLPKSVSRCVVT
jgi:hypothetical protein